MKQEFDEEKRMEIDEALLKLKREKEN